ncbi:MAG: dienelactone hydrolase family protein [Candidatus Bathyarchaeota archaeon]|nr:MAG: dienelactone hydrolase family protein [Candidatus Bathyarchaeota archaeon]
MMNETQQRVPAMPFTKTKNPYMHEESFESNGKTLSATLYGNSSVGVVLCPPHPLFGGSRRDIRIVKVAKELALHNISALCMDYGSYGKGAKEVENVLDAISWMRKKVNSLGLLGYSFGAVVASNAAARTEIDGFVAMSILRKVDDLEVNLNFNCPTLFVHGKHDDVALYSELELIHAKTKGRKEKFVLNTGHFYMENFPATIDSASERISRFFEEVLLK